MTNATASELLPVVAYLQKARYDRLQELATTDYSPLESPEPVCISLRELRRHFPDLYQDAVEHPETIEGWFRDAVAEYPELVETLNADHDLSHLPAEPFADTASVPEDTPPVDVLDEAEWRLLPAFEGDHPELSMPERDDVHIEFTDPPRELLIDLDGPKAAYINRLVAVEGMVRVRSEAEPIPTKLPYECQRCGSRFEIKLDNPLREEAQRPDQCKGCERKGPWRFLDDEAEREDCQTYKIQERLDHHDGGSNPSEIRCDAIETHLINRAGHGEDVTTVGILRDEEAEGNSPVRKYWLEVSSINRENKGIEDIELTDDEREEFHELTERDDLFDLLQRSVARNIHGHASVKRAVALQLFGAPDANLEREDTRGEIHILLIGDPSTGKSKIINSAREIAPRSVRASGTSSTGVGLTAAAEAEEINGRTEWVLKPGALPLADGGICTIDELDKIGEGGTDNLHEAMSEGTISVNKASITGVTVRAQASVLAAANPVDSRFNPHDPLDEQFGFDTALKSRFDLTFPFQDIPDRERDREIADQVVMNFSGTTVSADGGMVLARDEFRKYVAFARQEIDSVEFTPEAKQYLKNAYVDLRDSDLGEDDAPTLDARNTGASLRLAMASARARLSDTVELADAERAQDLIMSMLERFDFDITKLRDSSSTDIPMSQHKRMKTLAGIVEDLENPDRGAPKEKVLDRAEAAGIERGQAEHDLKQLHLNDEVTNPADGQLRRI